jgi:hypothetical protein
MQGVQVHINLDAQNGDNVLSQRSICKYLHMVRNVQDRLDKCDSNREFAMPLNVNQQ